MLVLSRKTTEEICIGPNIHITILSITDGRVRLGIEAPRDVPIHRTELQKRSFSDEGDVPTHSNCERIA
jgi:carbon storage regulator